MALWAELKRRNVFRVGIAYLAAVWLLLQVADIVIPILDAPDWLLRALFFSALLGFPLALMLAWFYELTPQGIKAASEVGPAAPVRFTDRKLDFAIIGLLVIAVGFLLVRPSTDENVALPNSVAVLPLQNLSPDAEDAYFATGLHDEILSQLAKLSNLSVISRTSVLRYAGSDLSIPEIARELNVSSIMEGTVRYADDRVRITTQLIDAERDQQLWSETYEREFADIFEIESDIAMNIANALRAEFSPEEAARISVRPTQNSTAYEFYLSGKDYFNRLDDRQFTALAVQQLQRAIDEDPAFGLAWAELARARLRMIQFDLGQDDEQLAMARQAVDNALALAPDAGEPYLALGWYHYVGEQNFQTALQALAVAEERMPGNSEVYLTRTYVQRRSGDWAGELVSIERALELDPHNVNLIQTSFGTYRRIQDYERAEAQLDRMLQLAPDHARYRRAKALLALARDGDFEPLKAAAASPEPLPDRESLGWEAALYERDYDLALRYLDAWELETPELESRPWERRSMYGVTHALADRADLARSEFDTARAQIEEALAATPDDAELHVDLGEARAWLGEADAAVRSAYRAIDLARESGDAIDLNGIRGNAITRVLGPAGATEAIIEQLDEYLQWGPWSIEGLLPDPRLDRVRGDSRFQELVERLRRQ